MAASPPKIWFSAKTGIGRIGRAPVFETIRALHLRAEGLSISNCGWPKPLLPISIGPCSAPIPF